MTHTINSFKLMKLKARVASPLACMQPEGEGDVIEMMVMGFMHAMGSEYTVRSRLLDMGVCLVTFLFMFPCSLVSVPAHAAWPHSSNEMCALVLGAMMWLPIHLVSSVRHISALIYPAPAPHVRTRRVCLCVRQTCPRCRVRTRLRTTDSLVCVCAGLCAEEQFHVCLCGLRLSALPQPG